MRNEHGSCSCLYHECCSPNPEVVPFPGTEATTHALQALTSLDENANVVSIDGVGSFDLISRNAMVSGLMAMRRLPKEKAANKVIHSCRCHSAWVCTRV